MYWVSLLACIQRTGSRVKPKRPSRFTLAGKSPRQTGGQIGSPANAYCGNACGKAASLRWEAGVLRRLAEFCTRICYPRTFRFDIVALRGSPTQNGCGDASAVRRVRPR